MAVPTSKSELLTAIEKKYDALAHDLKKVTPEQVALRSMEGHAQGTLMSVHDLVAYLVGWNELVLKWYQRSDQGLPVDFPETGFQWNELGKLAGKFYKDYAELSFEALLVRFDQAKSDLVRLIETLSDEALYGAPWYKTYTLGRMIQFNTSSPYANARGRLRKWLKAQA